VTGPTRRINHGRGHRYLLDGDQVDGVTTVVSKGLPKPALVDWAARETAGYTLDHWDELAGLGSAERLRRMERARFQTLKEASARGTDIHALVERIQDGEEVDVPEPLLGHVDAYLQFAKDWEPEELLVEAVLINRTSRYMGTADLFARLNDGNLWLLDWKTGKSGVWPEVALQLAAYRYAETYVGDNGQEHDLPHVDRCGALWLRADGYDLHPVQAGHPEFRVFQYAQQIARFASARREEFIGETLTKEVPV
jgi:hypothetical protein